MGKKGEKGSEETSSGEDVGEVTVAAASCADGEKVVDDKTGGNDTEMAGDKCLKGDEHMGEKGDGRNITEAVAGG
jgi:hypothetical protein